MKSLQDLDIFVRTVDSGSLSATARALDLTPAAASAALKRLEAELGVALFVRSTRSLRLTQEGALFLEHCRPALAALQQVQGQLAGGRAGGFGRLLGQSCSHGEHIKCSPARAELAIDLIYLPSPGAPTHRDLGWVLFRWQLLRSCPPWL